MSEPVPVPLIEHREVTAELRVFRFARPHEFAFVPGQFAVLGLPGDDSRLIERAYSIASSPSDDMLEFFIERVPNGRLTTRLFALRPGENVSVRPQARGRFLLDPGAASHLMVATVTGVAPFVSMARTMAQARSNSVSPAASPRAVSVLIHGASYAAELGYDVELAQALGGRYWPTVSRPAENPQWQGRCGRAESHIERAIAEFRLSPALTTAYLCGHPGMVAGARNILTRQGWPPERIRSESW